MASGMISPEDLELFHVLDDPEQVIDTIKELVPVAQNHKP
jgi:predicted Rossmann-fold nucleotide-binding protein